MPGWPGFHPAARLFLPRFYTNKELLFGCLYLLNQAMIKLCLVGCICTIMSNFQPPACAVRHEASQARQKRSIFAYARSQAVKGILHTRGQAPYPIQASKQVLVASIGTGPRSMQASKHADRYQSGSSTLDSLLLALFTLVAVGVLVCSCFSHEIYIVCST